MPTHFETLKTYLPWIEAPLIVNGPMAGFAGPNLAKTITTSHGLGQIGTINDPTTIETHLSQVKDSFAQNPDFSSLDLNTLPVGVGLLVFIGGLERVLPVLEKYKPAVIWMFAAKELDDYTHWAKTLRQASPESRIWIQTGSVTAALYLAEHTRPDALVIQGSDAGGHGLEKGAGIISLLPETLDALEQRGFSDIPVLASGGIADGRGVAAALALGACGVIMGTRFLSATETTIHPQYRSRILETSDGGQSTTRAKVFDELRGPNVWPVEYDGRGLVTGSYKDHVGGVDIEEIRKRHGEAVKGEYGGFGDGGTVEGRAVVWAGTGVGLVKREQGAEEIVVGVREEAKRALEGVRGRLKL